MEAFLRESGVPVSVTSLGQRFPRPRDIKGKLLTVLASHKRFELHGLESTSPMVQMRTTPPKAMATAAKIPVVSPHTQSRVIWLM